MSGHPAESVADAILYEGYVLNPYRSSALKNRYRWQFGIVAPRGYGAAGGAEPCLTQTQCPLEPGPSPVLDVKVRFLHVEARQVERAVAEDQWEPVDHATIDRRELVTWDEAIPRELIVAGVPVRERSSLERRFEIAGARSAAILRDVQGRAAARVVRETQPISCLIRLRGEPAGSFYRVGIRIENVTPWAAAQSDRPSMLRRSLVATHALLSVVDGTFVSMLDPPAAAAPHASACENLHTWPVLAGDRTQRDCVLSSPVVLYDYPEVAPESPGDLFDATEIDELLVLRVLTLTAEERRQALATDGRDAGLIERASNLSAEALARLHGTIRERRESGAVLAPSHAGTRLNPHDPAMEQADDVKGKRVVRGSRVRLRPGRRADAIDMFLTGRTARVTGVHRDLDDQIHVAVVVEDGLAADLHEQNGRFFYFGPDELEVLGTASASTSSGPRVLVAGIGNVFLGDDGFGPAVAQRLALRELPDWVRVEDFGIRSVHLAYDLLGASYEHTFVVDAAPRGRAPGTLYVIEPEVDDPPLELPDAHAASVESVLGVLRRIGAEPGRVHIVGCEPQTVVPEMGLSGTVAGAVDRAVDLVIDLIHATRP